MDYVASFIQTFFPDSFIGNFNAIVIGIGVAVGIAIWVLTRKKKQFIASHFSTLTALTSAWLSLPPSSQPCRRGLNGHANLQTG